MESSKFKLNKTKFIQISLLLLAFLLIFFTYFFNLKKKQPSTNLDLFSEKANFFNVKNELLIEGNVKTKSPEGELQADKLDFNLGSKKLKISMYNDKKVNIKVNF